MTSDFDALIVGAGAAGSTAAILLAQAGWSVAVVEKQGFPRRKVCGECIAAPNLPLLDALGVGAAFDQCAGPALRRVGLFVGDECLWAALPHYDHPLHPWARVLGRERLDTLLLRRAVSLGASLWQPWALRDVSRDDCRHVCTIQTRDLRRTTVLSARILIDAHGSWDIDPTAIEHSRRRPLGSDLFAFKGNFSGAELDCDQLPVLAFPGGYGGMVQGPDQMLTLACCMRRDRLQALRAAMPGHSAATTVLAHLQESCLGVRAALRHAMPHETWLSVGPLNPGMHTPASSATEFAIGNAAGEAHPILGEGISMAIQSAWLLCAQLTSRRTELLVGPASEQASQIYASAWRRSFATRLRVAALCAQLAMRPHLAQHLLPVLRHWPGLLTAAARLGGKVHSALDSKRTRPSAESLHEVPGH